MNGLVFIWLCTTPSIKTVPIPRGESDGVYEMVLVALYIFLQPFNINGK